MSYPFSTSFYDQLYSNISTVLKVEYPQQQDEDIMTWHKRLLYEFMSYVQAKYEPSTVDVKINPNKKANKKKNNPNNTKFIPSDEPLFDTNIENALDVVSQDSNFAIYLIIQWLPLLLSTADYICLCVTIDMSGTPASNVALSSIEIKIELTKITILTINGIKPCHLKERYFDKIKSGPLIKTLLKIINFYTSATTSFDYESIRDNTVIQLDPVNIILNCFKIGEFLYKIKNVTKQLFIKDISLKSNLITENSGVLSVSKTNSEKSQRKKFNGRKYIKTEEATTEEMASGIIQTLAISIFRTFYDFDKNTIDGELFEYLFYGKQLNL